MTIYSLDELLFLYGTSLLFHVQFFFFSPCPVRTDLHTNMLPDLHTNFSRGGKWVKIRESDLARSLSTHIHILMHTQCISKWTLHKTHSTKVIPSLDPCSYFIFHNPFLAANRTALSSFAAKKKFPSSSHYSILISFFLQAVSTPLCIPR